ncbi:MAG: hypothetical protein KAI45_09655, partial [Melioribacteraceae bacterium]|nr:hypothetical protein [Melioribacteraceae bacterium]
MIYKCSNFFLILLLASSVLVASDKIDVADSTQVPTEPNIHFSWLWGVAQLIPSPEWITTSSSAKFGMRWQVTPLLFSFGMNKKLSPWRYF